MAILVTTSGDGAPAHRRRVECHGCAVRCAYAEFGETWKGQLQPGFAADIVIWDSNLESLDPHELSNVASLHTICAGQVTYTG